MSSIFKFLEIHNAIYKQIEFNNRIIQTIPRIPTYDFSNIYNSLEPFQAQLNLISQQTKFINSSLKPFQDYMSSITQMINKNLEIAMPKFNFEYLNNLKIISSYSLDIVESIDKSLFINTIDEIYTSIDAFESDNDSIKNLDECKNSFFDLKQLIQNSSLTFESFCAFVSLLIAIFTLIQPYLDNSTEVMIEQQREIIELQKQQLDLSKDISDSLKKINHGSSNVGIPLENINKSLETLIESVEH